MTTTGRSVEELSAQAQAISVIEDDEERFYSKMRFVDEMSVDEAQRLFLHVQAIKEARIPTEEGSRSTEDLVKELTRIKDLGLGDEQAEQAADFAVSLTENEAMRMDLAISRLISEKKMAKGLKP